MKKMRFFTEEDGDEQLIATVEMSKSSTIPRKKDEIAFEGDLRIFKVKNVSYLYDFVEETEHGDLYTDEELMVDITLKEVEYGN